MGGHLRSTKPPSTRPIQGVMRLFVVFPDSTSAPVPPPVISGPWVVWPFLLTAVLLAIGTALFFRSRGMDRIKRFYASAKMASVFVLIGLLAGSVAEFRNDVILRAPPLVHISAMPVPAWVVFWISVAMLAGIGILHYASVGVEREAEVGALKEAITDAKQATADARTHTGETLSELRAAAEDARIQTEQALGELRRATEDAREHTTSLIAQLRTLPPEGFMRDFPHLSVGMLAPFSLAMASSDPAHIDMAIRMALRAAAQMAARFGRDPHGLFFANAMRFHPAESCGPMSTWSELQLRLHPEGFRYDAIEGALVFDPAQSTVSISDGAAPAPRVEELRIAIPNPPRDGSGTAGRPGPLRVLPGSASAFVTGHPFIAEDTHDMHGDLKEYSVPQAVLEASQQYFRNGDGGDVRSFISLPIRSPGENGTPDGPASGVLNIERSQTGIFDGNRETVAMFALTVAPVCFVIDMLWKMQGFPDGDVFGGDSIR